jgi:hypothetical protein
MKLLFFLIINLFFLNSTWAQEEAPKIIKDNLFKGLKSKLSGGLRFYPKGGRILYNLKKDYIIWGEKKVNGEASHKYGYISPHVTAYTAGYLNGARIDVDIFPISFFGIRFGHETLFNNKEYSAFECDVYNCLGGFDKSYIEIHGATKIKKVFYKFKIIRQDIHQRDIYKPNFVDALTGLVAKNYGDSFFVDHHTLGYLISDKWVISTLYIYARAQNIINNSDQTTVNITYFKDKKWTYNFGLGSFRSSAKVRKATALLLVNYKL